LKDSGDVKLLDGYMNNEILFKKMPYDAKKAIAAKYADISDEFEDVQIDGVKKSNGKDILGKKLQVVVIIGKIVATINDILDELVNNMEVETIKESLDDLLIISKTLGTEGRMQRITVIDSSATKFLRLNMKPPSN
jgi:hypothetical protein